MIYFHAGLGAAMLAGIMAMFEVGLSLTGQSLMDEESASVYYQDVVNSADQLFQKMLTDPLDLKVLGTGRYGDSLCEQILCRINGTGCSSKNYKMPLYASLQSYSTPKYAFPMSVWSSACALERRLDNNAITHRLLISPNRQSIDLGYELFSCLVDGNSADQRCNFERKL